MTLGKLIDTGGSLVTLLHLFVCCHTELVLNLLILTYIDGLGPLSYRIPVGIPYFPSPNIHNVGKMVGEGG